MDGLEMPQSLSGFRVQRDKAVAEQIVTGTVATVEIVSCGAEWNDRDATFFIDGQLTPIVNSTCGLIKFRWPRFISRFSGMGNGVEDPQELSCFHVITVNIARKRFVGAASCR
jgi:hypothetical protein